MKSLSSDVLCWKVAEIELTSQLVYENPYKDVTITAVFAGPQGQSMVREAFWCGQNLWKVRFAPTAVGRWTWKTACSDPTNAALHGQSGELRCVAYSGENPVYRHGFLRVSDNRRHFCHADGQPFLWLGDTHWCMPDMERVTECNHPEHAGKACPHGGQFQHLVADRKAKGFSVYQTYPSASNPHWWATSYTRINPDRFREVFDVQMDFLAAQGFVVALGFGHFADSNGIPLDDLRRWARYLVARYGAHPVVWITCQEMNAPEELPNRMDVWQAVACEIAAADGYEHPHSAHQWVLDVATRPLGQEPWHDWFALQGGHRNSGLTPQFRYKGYYDFVPTRPVLETEAMYEWVDCGGVNTTDEARQSAWKAMLCGSPGYTYGGAGIWALKWDVADSNWKDYNHAIGSWHEGMALPGAAQMAVLRKFFASLDWTALVPRFLDANWSQWRDSECCVLATDSNRLYLVYCYGESSEGTLKQLDPKATYEARWFDPRKGEYAGDVLTISPAKGVWAVPPKPTAEDWLLRVEKWTEDRHRRR